MNGISAIVATYRRKDELKRLFNSILDNQLMLIEVIVVDQNTDGLIDNVVQDYHSKIEIVHLKITEANQSKARNFGASKAKYPIVCFPDDDCWFENNSLIEIQRYFENNQDTALLVINWKQNPNSKITQAFELSKKDMFSFRSVGYVTYVLFFQTKIFNELGGFLESIGIGQYIGGGEDSELAFRAITRKLKIYFRPDIYVNHNYIAIYDRPIHILKARQRAMGLMYSLYDIPKYVIVRGFISPLIKLLFAFNLKKIKQHFTLFQARIEGYQYGEKNKKKLTNELKDRSL